MALLIARRPVFDEREQIFAYDLAVRSGADASGIHRDVSPEQLMAEVFLGSGIETVAGRHRIFVAASRELVLGGALRVLPADRVILDVPRVAPSDAELDAACHDLVSCGYQLAMGVDTRTPITDALGAAHVIKIDVIAFAPEALIAVAAELGAFPARLLATNVRHRGERDRCAALGFDLFEGYRFIAPETLSRRDIGMKHLQAFRVLKLLRDATADDRDIEALIQADVGLAYKLLRMVNTAAVGGRDIWSIGHAIRILGREQLARWLSVLLVTDAGATGVRAELTNLAVVRARMCEGVASLTGVPRAGGSLFLVGLLSVLDQLLEVPMDVLCDTMDLAPDLRNALLHRTDFFGVTLRLIEDYVSGRWVDIDSLAGTVGIASPALQPLYLDALQWSAALRRSDQAE